MATAKNQEADSTPLAVGTVRGTLDGWVYQGTSAPFANAGTRFDPLRQRRRLVQTPNPRTPGQVAQRAKLTAAIAAWKALPEVEKVFYRRESRSMTHSRRGAGERPYWSGFNYYVSLHMLGQLAE